jgi:hypothetical protein
VTPAKAESSPLSLLSHGCLHASLPASLPARPAGQELAAEPAASEAERSSRRGAVTTAAGRLHSGQHAEALHQGNLAVELAHPSHCARRHQVQPGTAVAAWDVGGVGASAMFMSGEKVKREA